MPLNKANGNMFGFVSHTINFIKGQCLHLCVYCFMIALNIRFDKWGELRLDEKEFCVNLGKDNFIFVGSSTDMWAANVPSEWITRVLDRCDEFDNRYLFQSKNPERFLEFINHPVMRKSVLSTTIETNRWDPDIMNMAPQPQDRANAMAAVAAHGVPTMVTIEPAMDFDHDALVAMIRACKPTQVNIGRNTVRSVQVPEPSRNQVQALIAELKTFTQVLVKPNASVWK
jgi:DNA repair photolyase